MPVVLYVPPPAEVRELQQRFDNKAGEPIKAICAGMPNNSAPTTLSEAITRTFTTFGTETNFDGYDSLCISVWSTVNGVKSTKLPDWDKYTWILTAMGEIGDGSSGEHSVLPADILIEFFILVGYKGVKPTRISMFIENHRQILRLPTAIQNWRTAASNKCISIQNLPSDDLTKPHTVRVRAQPALLQTDAHETGWNPPATLGDRPAIPTTIANQEPAVEPTNFKQAIQVEPTDTSAESTTEPTVQPTNSEQAIQAEPTSISAESTLATTAVHGPQHSNKRKGDIGSSTAAKRQHLQISRSEALAFLKELGPIWKLTAEGLDRRSRPMVIVLPDPARDQARLRVDSCNHETLVSWCDEWNGTDKEVHEWSEQEPVPDGEGAAKSPAEETSSVPGHDVSRTENAALRDMLTVMGNRLDDFTKTTTDQLASIGNRLVSFSWETEGHLASISEKLDERSE